MYAGSGSIDIRKTEERGEDVTTAPVVERDGKKFCGECGHLILDDETPYCLTCGIDLVELPKEVGA